MMIMDATPETHPDHMEPCEEGAQSWRATLANGQQLIGFQFIGHPVGYEVDKATLAEYTADGQLRTACSKCDGYTGRACELCNGEGMVVKLPPQTT